LVGWFKRLREAREKARRAQEEREKGVANWVDETLSQQSQPRVCRRCKGTDWRYLKNYNLWQCQTDWCGNLMTFDGPQASPPDDPTAPRNPYSE